MIARLTAPRSRNVEELADRLADDFAGRRLFAFGASLDGFLQFGVESHGHDVRRGRSHRRPAASDAP